MALDFAKGIATGVVSNNLRKVAGNLPGMLGGRKGSSDTSPFTKLTRTKSPHSVQQYKFPIDVDSDPGLGNHGHYVIFNINQQTNAKLSFGLTEEDFSEQDGRENIIKATKEYGLGNTKKILANPVGGGGLQSNVETSSGFIQGPPVNNAAIGTATPAGVGSGYTSTIGGAGLQSNVVAATSTGFGFKPEYIPHNWQDKVGMQLLNETVPDYQKGLGQAPGAGAPKKKYVSLGTNTDAQALHVKRRATKKLHASIALYMPANVQVQYGANYTDTEIGSMAELSANALEKFIDDDYKGGFKTLFGADEIIAQNTSQFLLSMAGNIAGFKGSKELEAMKAGRIISNRMELAFKGISKRKFQYTFKMIPRNAAEAKEIKDIIYAFKFNMLPEFEGGDTAGRSFIVPNTFDIKYMYNGKENDFLHKISTCVLESMDVTYGGDRYKTYTATSEGAPPVETTITLNFHEMEMITREAVKDRGM